MADLFNALQDMGAGEFAHFNGPLAQHLQGTAERLTRWGADETLHRAGLFHAAYGTAGYGEQLAPLSQRATISELIGADAEALVYLYCACDRNAYYPRIGTPEQLSMPNRFTGSEQALTDARWQALCWLTLANELDIAASSPAFARQHGPALLDLFNRMGSCLPEQGLHEARAILGPAGQ